MRRQKDTWEVPTLACTSASERVFCPEYPGGAMGFTTVKQAGRNLSTFIREWANSEFLQRSTHSRRRRFQGPLEIGHLSLGRRLRRAAHVDKLSMLLSF